MKKFIQITVIFLFMFAIPFVSVAQNNQKSYYCQVLTYQVAMKTSLKIKGETFKMYQTAVKKVTISDGDTTYSPEPILAFIPEDLQTPVSGKSGETNVGDLFLSLRRALLVEVVLVERVDNKWVLSKDPEKGIYLIVAFGSEEPFIKTSAPQPQEVRSGTLDSYRR